MFLNVIVCIDNNGGMLFNKRRQSRDICVIEKTMEFSQNGILRMNEYSKGLFSGFENDKLLISKTFLDDAGKGDWCFVETEKLEKYVPCIEKLVIFRWNRVYPADFVLDVLPESFKLIRSEEFKGNSHEKITMEVYLC